MVLITYELKTARDYTPFYAAIQHQGDWCHYLAATWLVNTTSTPQAIATALKPLMEGNDFLLVVEITSNYQGWLPKEAWDWINSRMYAATPTLPFINNYAAPTK